MAVERDACRGLGQAAAAAIVASGLGNPAQAYVGYPSDPDLTTIINNQGYALSVYPLATGENELFGNALVLSDTFTVPSLTASVSGGVVTLSGTVVVGVPVHIGINSGVADVEYTTQSSDTLTSIASALASLVNGAGVIGVTASSGTGTVIVSGANLVQATVVASSSLVIEEAYVTQRVQLSLWMPTSESRGSAGAAVFSGVGTRDNHVFGLSDGTSMDCFQVGVPRWSDESIQKKSIFVWRMHFDCTYSVTQTIQSTGIAAGSFTETLGDQSQTLYTAEAQ